MKLWSSYIETPLGPMIAMSDEDHLFLLEFADCPGLDKEIKKISQIKKSEVVPGESSPLDSITRELKAYYTGNLRQFKTPFRLSGTPFQVRTWEALQAIPYGETRSYAVLASHIDKPTSHRAVANANGANQLAILIPCHRVINTGGKLGGYKGALKRKEWLLNHERAAKN